jgi:acetylornithine deacetylase/succinyl-diaminopimelate desuccinylase-like protein
MRSMEWRATLVALVVVCGVEVTPARQGSIAAWRALHERQIVDELMQFVALPNVAGNDVEMRKNADFAAAMFRRRGFRVETSEERSGSPVVMASLDVPQPRGTLTLYIHYDGQPVTASEWTRCAPFAPCVVGPSGIVALDASRQTFDPEWRVYGRSTSDDKAPIVAVVNAVEALTATGQRPSWNLRVVLDGQEEAGSANFRRFVSEHPEKLRSDLAIMLDGPRHPSGRPTMYFGVRGGAGMTITVYGASRDLHSGNYGNWAPDPSMRLAKLLATMKDDDGRVTIAGFYDRVTPLTAAEIAALEAAPNVEAALRKEFGVVRPERAEERLERKLNTPTLSVLAMESGGGLKVPGRSAIPESAAARLEIRLVQGLVPAAQNDLVVAHIRKQGYFVVLDRDPTDDERRVHPMIVRVDPRAGSPASRVPIDTPMGRAVVAALTFNGVPPVQLPTLGGGMPYGTFSDQLKMPTVGVSIVNFDNNQHGPDENLRLANLWEGIEMMANVMTMTGTVPR